MISLKGYNSFLSAQGNNCDALTQAGIIRFKSLKFVYFIYYFFSMIFPFFFKRKIVKKNTKIAVCWSKRHSHVIDFQDSDSFFLNRKVDFVDILNLDFLTRVDVFRFVLKTRKHELKFMERFIYTVEFFCLKNIVSDYAEISIAGHFDRFTISLIFLSKSEEKKVTVFQHGAFGNIEGLTPLFVDKFYYLYPSSIPFIQKYFLCDDLEQSPVKEKDFDRIEHGLDLPDSILFIGQDINPHFNEMILNTLVGCYGKEQVYFLKHPRDRNVYKNGILISDCIRNPSLIVTRYSTLGFNYERLGHKVIYVDMDNVFVDFLNHNKNVISFDDLEKKISRVQLNNAN
ncbi:hypothetical protein KIP00_03180 [Vibrio sp. B513a]|uniref:hypothetical protein n=1 Tax=Vibrio sp. B513a TaxID=2836183 RepID=UPI0025558048|nr:hypothetical protein [Vibrio sp. B513a]MDK9750024.1 hypothetical protein [Vibrio sp. B513a]